MALNSRSLICELPEELLLKIAFELPDSATPRHLKNLCLVSRKFRPAAQEALHAAVKLIASCGCHPKVNTMIKLLRTVLNRPDLASKVKTLRFRTVRKNVAQLYEEQSFDLQNIRTSCLLKLEEMGYKKTHPWSRSLENSIESAFAGVLFALLPNLAHLDFWVKDHHRGPPSSEGITGLYGSMAPPKAVLNSWKSLRHLTTGDTHLLKCGFELNLTSLDLRTISVGTLLHLNGPASLQGAVNLSNLELTVSVQFADRPLIDKAEVQFSDLFDALGCKNLSSLRILLSNDGYHIGHDLMTQLDAGYFIDQLQSVEKTLQTLTISFETTEDEAELEWLLDMCSRPKKSLRNFAALKQLVMPQSFLFATSSHQALDDESWSCQPKDLPSELESLELLYPHEDVEMWAWGFMDKGTDQDSELPNFKELTFTCRDEVGAPSGFFNMDVEKIWWTLSEELGIETYVFCQTEGSRTKLAELYLEEGHDSDETDGDSDADHWIDEDEESDIDSDSDMPDLLDPMD